MGDLWGEVEGKPETEVRRWRRREPRAVTGPEGFLEEVGCRVEPGASGGSAGGRENGLSEGRLGQRAGRGREEARRSADRESVLTPYT